MVWLLVLLWLGVAGCETQAARTPPPAPPPMKVEKAPRSADRRAAFAAAHHALRDGRNREACEILRPLVGNYPAIEDYVLHYFARCSAALGRVAEAQSSWSGLASDHPQSVHFHAANLGLGRLLREAGQSGEAKSAFETAAGSDDPEVRLPALLEIALMEESPRTAHAALMSVRELAAGTATGREAKAHVLALRQRRPDLEPRGADLEREVDILMKERDFVAALSVIKQLLGAATPAKRPALLRTRADAELGSGQLDRALATLGEIVRHYPQSRVAPEAAFRRARLLWNKDRNEEAKRAFNEFLALYPTDPNAAEGQYSLGRIAQSAGRSGEAIQAYRRLAERYPRSSFAYEARWRIGWIQYERGDFRAAADTFGRLARGALSDINADSFYWRARSLERLGEKETVRTIYQRLVEELPDNYYAHWAQRRLGLAEASIHSIGDPMFPFPEAPPEASSYHVIRARELRAAGLPSLALRELRAIESHAKRSPRVATFLAGAYKAVHGYRDAMRVKKEVGGNDPATIYPLAFWSLVNRYSNGLDPVFVLSLMRQESMFDPQARSWADARGLMQLLPSTAEREARRIGLSFAPGEIDLYDPETNIRLGTAHLQYLNARYGGDWLRVLAAYNGGEEAVERWDRQRPGAEPDEWVENITYRETRSYVKKIISNYRKYRRLYGAPPPAAGSKSGRQAAAVRLNDTASR